MCWFPLTPSVEIIPPKDSNPESQPVGIPSRIPLQAYIVGIGGLAPSSTTEEGVPLAAR